jgi:hypothetical protein
MCKKVIIFELAQWYGNHTVIQLQESYILIPYLNLIVCNTYKLIIFFIFEALRRKWEELWRYLKMREAVDDILYVMTLEWYFGILDVRVDEKLWIFKK